MTVQQSIKTAPTENEYDHIPGLPSHRRVVVLQVADVHLSRVCVVRLVVLRMCLCKLISIVLVCLSGMTGSRVGVQAISRVLFERHRVLHAMRLDVHHCGDGHRTWRGWFNKLVNIVVVRLNGMCVVVVAASR